MKKYLSYLSVISLSLLGSLGGISLTPLAANAQLSIKLEATVSADNHYGLFVGNQDASDLLLIGRNEKGPFHIPDTIPPVPNEIPDHPLFFNWEGAESWLKILYKKYKYIYMVVWGDEAVHEGWLGKVALTFTCKTRDCFGTTIVEKKEFFSSDESWEYLISYHLYPGDFGEVPSNSEIHEEVSSANNNSLWMPAIALGSNDGTTLPWKHITGIDNNILILDAFTPDNYYRIFRQEMSCIECNSEPIECVPEPSMILGILMASSLGVFFKLYGISNKLTQQ
ncbi:PEP-CTERM sorting domain-containing protein [Gloeothece verrucosa]|uniref:PEP-CTERM protein-sorting domain-containing protein n=1 Tax=Gloeothece verrucosa (strain PCC 7822) TaxID=497965 RepID=E0UKQ6_GLOV7|nr:PEP-CTERM sorting domain-containing protein [Gloeothece verrucosa]ADN17536.1 hypothetical protein Cyan7822_5673 [Gloeothece verrucosa PCC 7822]